MIADDRTSIASYADRPRCDGHNQRTCRCLSCADWRAAKRQPPIYGLPPLTSLQDKIAAYGMRRP